MLNRIENATRGVKSLDLIHLLEDKLCPQCFDALLSELGGLRVNVPSPDTYLRQKRNWQMYELWKDKSWSIRKIAHRYKMSERQTHTIIVEMNARNPNGG